MNHRTHRKVLVVDESIAFTGGVGIADEWKGDARNEHEWRDTHFRIHGPAVDGLRAAFLDNWAETDPELFDEGIDRFPDQPKPGDVDRAVRAGRVRDRVERCRHPVPHAVAVGAPVRAHHDRVLRSRRRDHQAALRRGRPRACTCRSCCPARTPTSDSSSSRARPRTASSSTHGIELWNFQPSMMHAKIMTIDGVVANIGSANLNSRSTACDEEINVVALDPELVRILDEQFDADLERSVQIKEVRWERRTLPQRVSEHLVTPLRRWF